ncbi:MAG: hypothetical protein JSW60_03735 [Thermoplasmatales archaeon]|nr:MAG: hypothetical protein JSW60_03735 [Thermoplasmatales archaeon]
MKKKIKIFGIGAAILLVMLSLSPTVTADISPEISSQLQEFAEDYSEEAATIKNFLAENNVTEEELVPHEIVEMIEEMLPDMEEIVDAYLEEESPPPGYDGHNAYWKSDEAAQFFDDETPPDYHYYKGHVLAIDKPLSDIFCYLVLELDWGVELLIIFLWFILPGIIWLLVAEMIELIWGEFVDWIRGEAQYSEFGIHFDFFKRDIWHPTPALNRFYHLLQPDEPWDPEDEDLYPESTWTAIIGPL